MGIVIGCTRAGFDVGAWLTAAAMASAFMVSYARARAEWLGYAPGKGMAAVGLAPREVRVVILVRASSAPASSAASAARTGATVLALALVLIAPCDYHRHPTRSSS